MANIRVRPETGNLQLDFYYLGRRCREQTNLKDTKVNRNRLQKVADIVKSKLSDGTFRYRDFFPHSKRLSGMEELERVSVSPVPPVQEASLVNHASAVSRTGVPLFKDFARQFIEENKPAWRRSNIRTKVEIVERKLIPFFGEKVISDIDKQLILEFRSELAKAKGKKPGSTMSASRINHIMTCVKQIIDEAADRFEFTTPYRGIKRMKTGKAEIDPFTFEEVNLIINNCRPDFRNYFTTKLLTGMRPGEIHGLLWENVDFHRRIIIVNQALVDDEIEDPKTLDSYRDIQMTPQVYAALVAQKKVTGGKSEYVFCTKEGTPLTNRNMANRIWHPMLRMLKLKSRSPYQTRHTFATLMLASGEAPAWIAQQMGHANTEMLFKVYTRFVPNLTRQDGSAFSSVLASKVQVKGAELCVPMSVADIKAYTEINNALPMSKTHESLMPLKASELESSSPRASTKSNSRIDAPSLSSNQFKNPWLEMLEGYQSALSDKADQE